MAKDDPDVFYVNLNDPIDVHRSILESTKHILNNLKRYEGFNKIRTYKLEYIMELKSVMSEINLLVNRLNREMPKTGLRASDSRFNGQAEVVSGKKQEVVSQPPISVHKSKLELLEQELDDIEAKLRKLE